MANNRHGWVNRRSVQIMLLSVPLTLIIYRYATMENHYSQRVSEDLRAISNDRPLHTDHVNECKNRTQVSENLNDKLAAAGITEFHKKVFRLRCGGGQKETFDTGMQKRTADRFFKINRLFQYTNCAAIVDGDEEEINKTIALYDYNSTAHSVLETDNYTKLTSDCDTFTRDRHYITEPLTEEESDFPIAYSILMYTDIEQFEKLLRTIYRPQNFYCIHVDLKTTDALYNPVTAIAKCFPNVYMIRKRVHVVWGKMSVLKPDLLCMRLLHKDKRWKYFINLTGQEFPLKTNYELVKILKAYNGANDVEGTIKRANKDRWKNSGDPPHGIIPTKGHVHAILSRGFVEFVLKDVRANELLKWLKTTEVPDETFFASLNHNPHLKVPGSYTGVPETDASIKPYMARYKNWGDYSCRGKYLRGICIFGVGDLPVLARRAELFANKFLWDYQPATLDCLEEMLYNRTRDEYFGILDIDASMYGSFGFVVNQTKVDN